MNFTKIIGFFAVMALFTSCSNAQDKSQKEEVTAESKAVITLIAKADFKKMLGKEGAQLIDVRTPREVSQGKIGEAVNMNFHDANFKEQLGGLDKSKPVLIYCASGGRSGKAVAMMKEMGFQEIHELQGGYNAWN
jgi:rhodanese-related sulfurtransferase